MTICAVALTATVGPRIYTFVSTKCFPRLDTEERMVEQPRGPLKYVACFIHSLAYYWTYTSPIFLLDFWHVSIYDSLGVGVFVCWQILKMPYHPVVVLLLTLVSSMVIELIRKVTEHFFRSCMPSWLTVRIPGWLITIMSCLTTTSLLSGNEWVWELDNSEIQLQICLARTIGLMLRRREAHTSTRSSSLSPELIIASGTALALLLIDVCAFFYFPIAYTCGLYPFHDLQQDPQGPAPNLDDYADHIELIDRGAVGEDAICPITYERLIYPCRPHNCSHLFERSAMLAFMQMQRAGRNPPCPLCRAEMLPRSQLSSTHQNAQRRLALERSHEPLQAQISNDDHRDKGVDN